MATPLFRRTKCGAPPTAAERKWALPIFVRGIGGVAPIGDGNCESSFLANKKVATPLFRRTKCGAPPTAAERKWALLTFVRGIGGVAPIYKKEEEY
ncbi:MAG: hypothetical protein FWF81_07980 [Defluviitaleaceae bacterium]|nr:hypothetical protein [Defluviitaleaceae bacterium]